MRNINLTLFLSLFVEVVYAQFGIGHTTITFNDPSRSGGFGSGGGVGRQIQTEIYYPANVSGENTTIASGSFPIVVFGHGFAMSWDAYSNIWEHYVTKGFILAFPRTEGSLIPSPSHNDFALDLNVVQTKMLALDNNSGSSFYQKLNGRSAIMGHSMGGGASILAGSLNSTVNTVIGLAPAETNPSAITAAVGVTVPSLIFSGSSDGVTPPDQHHIPIYNGLGSSCKSFASIIGGAHCYFANANFNCDFGESTSSSGISITRVEQQQRTYSLLDHWLAYFLQQDCQELQIYLDILDDDPSAIAAQSTCTSNPIPIITDNSSTLHASTNGTAYQWYLDGNMILGANAQNYITSGTGSYVVEVFYADGCSQISAPYVLLSGSTLTIPDDHIQVYPNPVFNDLYVEGFDIIPFSFVVRDVQGQTLFYGQSDGSIPLHKLSPGAYLLQLNTKTFFILKK